MAPTTGAISPGLVWRKVDVLTSYQRVSAELQVRGRLRETMNDNEGHFYLRNISAEPLLPGAVPIAGIPEGMFSKSLIGGIRTVDPEPPSPDMVAEVMRRYIMFQATTFMVTGAAEFPKATEAAMHNEILLKSRFFPIVDATVTIFGVAGRSWTQPTIWVNRDLMLGVFLG